jgi:NADH:ubiquinone oxidoreductase subunit F (NADH-binding)
VRIVDERTCGVDYAARIMDFLAAGSALQCGPCKYGLADLAGASGRLAGMDAKNTDLYDIERWTALVTGRGACRHPDGAAQQMSTALAVFADDFASHADRRRCLAAGVMSGAAR